MQTAGPDLRKRLVVQLAFIGFRSAPAYPKKQSPAATRAWKFSAGNV
jgi:hypothetical protein